jgi:hypothetical protein
MACNMISRTSIKREPCQIMTNQPCAEGFPATCPTHQSYSKNTVENKNKNSTDVMPGNLKEKVIQEDQDHCISNLIFVYSLLALKRLCSIIARSSTVKLSGRSAFCWISKRVPIINHNQVKVASINSVEKMF